MTTKVTGVLGGGTKAGVAAGDLPAPEPIVNPDAQGTTGQPQHLRIQVDLFRFGKDRAEKSGAFEPVVEDVEALEAHARAMAWEQRGSLYDPARHHHDRLRETEYERLVAERDEAERTRKHARAALRDQELIAAHEPALEPEPALHPLLLMAAVAVIALTVAPTLHDAVFIVDDDILSWILSSSGAGLAGLFLVWGVADGMKGGDERHVGAAAAGVLVGLALGVVRLAGAHGFADFVLAGGLTLLEVGAVVLLEAATNRTRHIRSEWRTLNVQARTAARSLEVLRAEAQRADERCLGLAAALKEHLAHVEVRSHQHLRAHDLEEAAVKAVVDGYRAGLAGNRGRVVGVRQ